MLLIPCQLEAQALEQSNSADKAEPIATSSVNNTLPDEAYLVPEPVSEGLSHQSVIEDINTSSVSTTQPVTIILPALPTKVSEHKEIKQPKAVGNNESGANITPVSVPAVTENNTTKSATINSDRANQLSLTVQQTQVEVEQSNRRDLDRHLDAIEAIEAESGPYDDQLSQQLVGLGIGYQRQGQHDQAIDVFKRAVHINRINEGLYNLNQVTILDHMIDSNMALNRWHKVNDLNHYLVWLNKRSPDKNDLRVKQMLKIVNKLSEYHLNAYILESDQGPFYHLVQAQDLFRLSINIIASHFGHTDPRLINPLRGLSASNYFLTEFSNKTNTELRNKIMMGNIDQKPPTQNFQKYIINNYSTGKEAITQLSEVYRHNPELPQIESLKARVELGDWYLMFDRKKSAFAIYKEIISADIDDLQTKNTIDNWFSKPVSLPDLRKLSSSAESSAGLNSYVVVQFDVTPYGKARNIEILNSQPEKSVRIRSKARDNIKRSRFRPKFEQGIAVTSYGLKRRYIFSEKN